MTHSQEHQASFGQAGTSGASLETTPSPETELSPWSLSSQKWQRALVLPISILAWMVIGITALWLLGHIAHALIVVALAVVVTFALAPLVSLLRRWLGRPVAIACAYLLGVGIVIGLGAVLVIAAAGQVVSLVHNLPTYMNRLNEMSPQTPAFNGLFGITVANIRSFNQQVLADLQANGNSLALGSLNLINKLVSVLLDIVLIIILSIYLTIDGKRVVDWLKYKIPLRVRRYTPYLLSVSHTVVGGYVRGTLSMALVVGVLVGVGLQVLGIRYALLLGILAFFMEFVPIVGVLISGAISLLVALPYGMGIILAVLVYFIAVHILEGYVIGPRVMGKAVGIHPATGIIALLVGTELFGVWGGLFGAPLAGLLQAIVVGMWLVRQNSPIATVVAPVEVPMGISEELETSRSER